MPRLLDVQRAMIRAVVDRDALEAALYVVAGGLAPADRLAVYRNTFDLNLAKALRLTFPAVEKLVGAEFFEGAALVFVHQYPPRSGCLDDYGSEFADFLARFGPASSLEYLPDVARLEWAVGCAIHAADSQALDLARLAELPDGADTRLRFVFNPAFRLLRVQWPADTIWRAVLEDDDAALGRLDPVRGAIGLLVRRGHAGIDVRRVSESEWRFAADLAAGVPLGAAIESHSNADTAAVLASFLVGGDLVGFELNSHVQHSELPEAVP